MKISANRELLEKKLKLVTSVMIDRSPIPIRDEALIEIIDNDKIKISASNDMISLSTTMPVEISGESFDFVADVRTILGTISLLNSEDVIIDVDEKKINFSTPKTRKKYSVPNQYKAKDFIMPKVEFEDDFISVPGDVFSELIKINASIVNPNTIVQQLSGISFHVENGEMIVMSAMDNTLCRNTYKLKDDSCNSQKILIPKAITNIVSSFEKSPEIRIYIDKNEKNIMIDDYVSISTIRLIDSKFSDVNPLFNNHNIANDIVVNRMDFLSSIKRMSNFTSKSSPAIKLDFSEHNMINIETEDIDYRKEASEVIEATNKPDHINFVSGINVKFITTALNSISSDNIIISQSNYNQPFFIVNTGEHVETKWIIAPIVLKQN